MILLIYTKVFKITYHTNTITIITNDRKNELRNTLGCYIHRRPMNKRLIQWKTQTNWCAKIERRWYIKDSKEEIINFNSMRRLEVGEKDLKRKVERGKFRTKKQKRKMWKQVKWKWEYVDTYIYRLGTSFFSFSLYSILNPIKHVK